MVFGQQHACAETQARLVAHPRRGERLAARARQQAGEVGLQQGFGQACVGAGMARTVAIRGRAQPRQRHHPGAARAQPRNDLFAGALDQPRIQENPSWPGRDGEIPFGRRESGTRQTKVAHLFAKHLAQPRILADHRHRIFVGQAGQLFRACKHFGLDLGAEAGAVARHAGEAQPTAHHLGQLPGDRETEPGAAIAPRHRIVGLGEGLEEIFLGTFGNADAGIFDCAAQANAHSVGWRRLRRLFEPHHHLPRLGELDRVRHQVAEHLPEAMRVAAHRRRHRRVHQHQQLETLELGALGKQQHHFFDRPRRRERKLLELELAGLDLGKVEDVVDDEQQQLGRAVQHVDETALALVERGVAEQVRHAQDAVHRRADLVAHVRKEEALGEARGLGLLLGGAQFGGARLDLRFEMIAMSRQLFVALLDPAQHLVESGDQLAHLVALAGRRTQVILLVDRHLAGDPGEPQHGVEDHGEDAVDQRDRRDDAEPRPGQREQQPHSQIPPGLGERQLEGHETDALAIVHDAGGGTQGIP